MASQPGLTSTLPSVLKWCPTAWLMRVVTRYSALGKNTARKRRTTRSYSFCSASERPLGACSVGMMAKWSLTLLSSNTRLVGLTYWLSSACRANGARCGMCESASMPMVWCTTFT